MGKFKSLLMEREDEFWSIAQDNIGDCDSVDVFVDLMEEHFDLHSKTDKEAITEEYRICGLILTITFLWELTNEKITSFRRNCS